MGRESGAAGVSGTVVSPAADPVATIGDDGGAATTTGSGRGAEARLAGMEATFSRTEFSSAFPCSISVSMVFFSSSEARLNSARPFPSDFQSSGSFFGPNTSSATTKISTSSGIPIEPNMFPPASDSTPGSAEEGGGRADARSCRLDASGRKPRRVRISDPVDRGARRSA